MIVDRVVLGRLAPRALGWLGVVVGLYAIADLADALSGPVPWARLPLRLPAMVFQGLPVALGAAAAHTVTTLRRTGEWTAIAAAGVGDLRRVRGVVAVAVAAVAVAWALGDAVAPPAARAFRGAGGGPPPGAVVLPMPAAGWTRHGEGQLQRGGPAPLVVRFGRGGGPPSITVGEAASDASDASHAPAAALPHATDASRAELLRLAGRAGDALPYALEAAFRPLVAAAALLVPLLVLALVAPRPLGPRAAAGATVAACLVAYAVIAVAFSLAAAGTVPPSHAALAAATALGIAAAGAAVAGHARPRG